MIETAHKPVAGAEWGGPNARGEYWVRFKHQAEDAGYGLKGPFASQEAVERCCDALLIGLEEGRNPP